MEQPGALRQAIILQPEIVVWTKEKGWVTVFKFSALLQPNGILDIRLDRDEIDRAIEAKTK